jgi:hypothetical protein
MGGIWLVEVKMNYNKKELPVATSALYQQISGTGYLKCAVLLRPSSYLGIVILLVLIFRLICTYRTVYPRYRTQLGVCRYLDT